MQLARLILAHAIELVHVYIFRHWPYWTCYRVSQVWPDVDHMCWLCQVCGWNQPYDEGDE